MAYRLEDKLRSWEGISNWYNWNSLDVWLRKQRRIESSMVIPTLEENLNNIRMHSHEVIRWKILENPEMVELPSDSLCVLDEPVCRTRNGRVVICAPDLIFVYTELLYLVEIKSVGDEVGVRRQLVRDREYFLDRFNVDCKAVGIYVEDDELKYFHHPQEWAII